MRLLTYYLKTHIGSVYTLNQLVQCFGAARQQRDDGSSGGGGGGGGGSAAHGKTVVYGGAFPTQRGAARRGDGGTSDHFNARLTCA